MILDDISGEFAPCLLLGELIDCAGWLPLPALETGVVLAVSDDLSDNDIFDMLFESMDDTDIELVKSGRIVFVFCFCFFFVCLSYFPGFDRAKVMFCFVFIFYFI